ncbi:translation machinery-associated protein 16 [Tirmania nivea]|nr:translation machinery-associated protein 16 [Tirmania nivea]
MSKALSKVTKAVKDKREHKGDFVHPGSRDHRRLNRAAVREQRLRQTRAERKNARDGEFNRLCFIQDAVKERQLPVFSELGIHELITSFIHRDDDERNRLRKERRPGRPPTAKEDLLRLRLEKEEGEYRMGFQIPDLSDAENVQKFIAWDGTHGSLSLIKFTRMVKKE